MPKDTSIAQCDSKSQKCYPPPANSHQDLRGCNVILEAKDSGIEIADDLWVTYIIVTL